MVSLIFSKTFIFLRFGGDSLENDAKIGGKTQKFKENQSPMNCRVVCSNMRLHLSIVGFIAK